MKLTKTFALAAALAGSLFTMQAQDSTNTPPAGGPPGGGMRGRPNMDMMAKDLGLSDDQKAKMKVVMEDTQTQMKALRDDTSLSKEEKMAKGKELRESTQAKMKEILTPEQLAKWQKHMQQNRPPGGPGGEGKPKGPPQQ